MTKKLKLLHISYRFRVICRGGSRIFFRRGCTCLLLYFNTNKPHSFFLQNTSCIRKPQVISGGGGAHPLHPLPRSAPNLIQVGLESFRFYEEDDYEIEMIFPILSIGSARVRENVILAGKCGSHRHSTTSFSENVVVAGKSYQMLGILSFSNRERELLVFTLRH